MKRGDWEELAVGPGTLPRKVTRPGDFTHATPSGRIFGVTPVVPLSAPFTVREGGNLLARMNGSFAAGLRGAAVYARTDANQPVFADGGALVLQPDQVLITETFIVSAGLHTLSFDLEVCGTPAQQVVARVTAAGQTPEGGAARPVYAELGIAWEEGELRRHTLEVVVPPGSKGLNIQIGEARALQDAFTTEAPGWSRWAEGTGPIVQIDRLALRRGAVGDYEPSGPVEFGLSCPASDSFIAMAGGELKVLLTLVNPGERVVEVRISGDVRDILHGERTSLSFDACILTAGQKRVLPVALRREVGQHLLSLVVEVGGEVQTLGKVLTFLSSPTAGTGADSPFIGRALFNTTSHESCRLLGMPSSRLLGDGMPYPLNWQIVQPARDTWEWHDSDRFVHQLTRAQISPLIGLLNYNHRTEGEDMTVLAPPPWVESELPGPGVWPTLRKAVPRDLRQWCEYVRAVVSRYRREIRVWEVINEPGGIMAASAYLPLLATAWRTIKEIDPDLTVVGICSTGDGIGEETTGEMVGFLEECLAGGAADHLDVISIHPYVWPDSPERGNLPETLAGVRELCARFAPGKPVWSTEFGWNSAVVGPNRPRTEQGPNQNLYAGEYTAMDCANFVARGLLLQLGAGLGKVHLFNNPQPGRMHPFRANGLNLFDYDHTPLPVFIAAREVAQRLSGATLEFNWGEKGEFLQVYRTDPGLVTAVCWCSEDVPQRESLSVQLPDGAVANLVDLFGRSSVPLSGACELPLSPSPFFLEVSGISAGEVAECLLSGFQAPGFPTA